MFFMTNVHIWAPAHSEHVCKYPRILHWRDEIQLATSEWNEPPQRRVIITNPYWSETLGWEVSRLSHPTLHSFHIITCLPLISCIQAFSFVLKHALPFLVLSLARSCWLILFHGPLCTGCNVIVWLKGKPPHQPVMVPNSWQ